MSTHRRNYRAEYERRLTLGRMRGVSRSAARGHAGRRIAYNASLESALKRIRDGVSLSRAARSERVSAERLRAYLYGTGVARREGRRWSIGRDQRPREIGFYSQGRVVHVRVPDYESSRLVGQYLAAVARFLDTNDATRLAPYAGRGVRDTSGRFHAFEVRPNELYRLTVAGPLPIETYKILM